jgi:hypothetical protein
MPLLDFWATEEGTVVVKTATTVTLTLQPPPREGTDWEGNPLPPYPVATGTYPWNNSNQTTRNNSTYHAAYFWINDNILGQWNIPSGHIWDYRCQYARFEDEIVDAAAARAALPPQQRGQWDFKQGEFIRYRNEYKALAGE